MTSVAEVLGLSFARRSSIPAVTPIIPRWQSIRRRIVEMVWEGLKPRDILRRLHSTTQSRPCWRWAAQPTQWIHMIALAGPRRIKLIIDRFRRTFPQSRARQFAPQWEVFDGGFYIQAACLHCLKLLALT